MSLYFFNFSAKSEQAISRVKIGPANFKSYILHSVGRDLKTYVDV